MGFGCNAVGVTGCRIIDSPRERLLAVLTNVFVPCNGRFPAIIAVLTMFLAFGISWMPALLLTLVLVSGVVMTFCVTKFLSKTVLKGEASSFILELPPYRTPQVGKVIIRSLLDRTVFVLGRAVSVAAPAGLVIWLMANIYIGDISILAFCADFLDPFASVLGLDGVILMAFILGFPANEIVIPIIIMVYTASGTVTDISALSEIKALFIQNGWTWTTAVSMIIFTLFHWPCSTTLITVKKETGSTKWTLLAALLPTGVGMICCTVFTSVCRMFGV